MKHLRWSSHPLILLLSAIGTACSSPSGSTPPPPPTLDRIDVSPLTATVVEGATQQLTAVGKDAEGQPFTPLSVTWSSSAELVASVNASGLVTAVAPGVAEVRATGGGKVGAATITVPQPAIASVVLSPAVGEIEMGNPVTMTATVKDVLGRVVTPVLDWTSNHPEIATVNAAGVVTPVKPGAVQIAAAVGGQRGTAEFVLVPPYVAVVIIEPRSKALLTGESAPLAVTLKSSKGDVLVDRQIVWESRNLLAASVNLTGQVLAAEPGESWIVATSEGITDSILVTVSARPPEGFELTLVNHLLVNAKVTLNGTPIADLSPGGTVVYFFAPIATVRIAWQLVRPVSLGQPIGEAVLDTFPQANGVNGAKLRFDVGATLTDGRRLVTPFLTNTSGSTVLFEFGVRETTLQCGCILPADLGELSGFGYWLLTETQTLRLFRRNDSGHTGPMLSLPVPPAGVDPSTGAWHFTITAGP